MAAEPRVPVHVAELADACVQHVQQSLQVELDYTQDTLPILDHYLRLAPDETPDDVLVLVAAASGAYFGEVVRRHFDKARWFAPEKDYGQWRVEFDECFLYLNPVGMVFEALARREHEQWSGSIHTLDEDREAAHNALDTLG